MYKAKIDIGDFKKGDVVPTEQALVWKGMYKISPVEEVEGNEPEAEHKGEVVEEEPKKDKSEDGSILKDYLARGNKVVIKNIEKDKLSKEQVSQLLKFEKSDKNRESVLEAIEKRLATFD